MGPLPSIKLQKYHFFSVFYHILVLIVIRFFCNYLLIHSYHPFNPFNPFNFIMKIQKKIQKKLKICNNLLVMMMFGSTKSDLTILNKMYNTSASGDGGGGISMTLRISNEHFSCRMEMKMVTYLNSLFMIGY